MKHFHSNILMNLYKVPDTIINKADNYETGLIKQTNNLNIIVMRITWNDYLIFRHKENNVEDENKPKYPENIVENPQIQFN